MEQYCMYLRKSRKDVQAEKQGEGDTLKRHKKALYDLAERLKIEIHDDAVYEEVVSGETISARPEMQELLKQIDGKMWSGVFVIEVERLTRGDHKDQGTIIEAFMYSKTKIVTPMKTYDPTNPSDLEYLEFLLFMSRQEYKTITRRLQDGRSRSVLEGKYVGNKTLYGYTRVELPYEQGWTLEENPEQADVVRDIFEWYTEGVPQEDGTRKRLGVSLIARRLNKLKIPSHSGKQWHQETIRDMLINPHYIGKVRWNWRRVVKAREEGETKKSRPRNREDNCIVADGLHEGIIPEDVFNRAQMIMNSNPPRPVGERGVVKNPLSGLVVCGKCKRRMTRRPYGSGYPDTILCQSLECDTVSSHLHLVEKAILDGLADWLIGYKLQWGLTNPKKKRESAVDLKRRQTEKKEAEIAALNQQLSAARDALERGVYDDDEYIGRRRELGERIKQAVADLVSIQKVITIEAAREENRVNVIPKVEHVLAVYRELDSPAAKNDLLKSVLEKVEYTKEKSGRWHASPDDFQIELFPILPDFTGLSSR